MAEDDWKTPEIRAAEAELAAAIAKADELIRQAEDEKPAAVERPKPDDDEPGTFLRDAW